ncbi:MAG TPA: hypothetical protein PLU78_05550 [Chitinophagales bacterium]|nr:hypothetical protein [Chitinophagales bacterium]
MGYWRNVEGVQVKILLFCPTWSAAGVLAIRQETLDSIDNLIRPEGVELTVKISDNNIRARTGDRRGDHENTLHQYQLARRITLEENFDYLFTVEHDMIIPEDALVKLLEVDAGVAYGVYRFRQNPAVLNVYRPVGKKARWPNRSLDYFPEVLERARRQVITDCSGLGFGCTLIKREVLEKVEMRRFEVGGHPSPDMQFAADCVRLGIVMKAHFGVSCGHIKPNGTVLWPEDREDDMKNIKIYINKPFRYTVGGRSTRFKEGEEVEFPEDAALELARGGYLTILEPESPAVKIVNKPRGNVAKAVK